MRTHTITVRIYYEDTDFSGIVYHANYLRYFERGRTEALRDIGVSHRDLLEADDPRLFAARGLNITYRTPARVDDLLTIETTVIEARGARIVFDQKCLRNDKILAEAQVEIACIDQGGRPKRLPHSLIEKMTAV